MARGTEEGAAGLHRSISNLKQNEDDLFGFMAWQFDIAGEIESPIPD